MCMNTAVCRTLSCHVLCREPIQCKREVGAGLHDIWHGDKQHRACMLATAGAVLQAISFKACLRAGCTAQNALWADQDHLDLGQATQRQEHWEIEQQNEIRHPEPTPVQPFAGQAFAQNLIMPSGGWLDIYTPFAVPAQQLAQQQ